MSVCKKKNRYADPTFWFNLKIVSITTITAYLVSQVVNCVPLAKQRFPKSHFLGSLVVTDFVADSDSTVHWTRPLDAVFVDARIH